MFRVLEIAVFSCPISVISSSLETDCTLFAIRFAPREEQVTTALHLVVEVLVQIRELRHSNQVPSLAPEVGASNIASSLS